MVEIAHVPALDHYSPLGTSTAPRRDSADPFH
jgi:hypothetical protein